MNFILLNHSSRIVNMLILKFSVNFEGQQDFAVCATENSMRFETDIGNHKIWLNLAAKFTEVSLF